MGWGINEFAISTRSFALVKLSWGGLCVAWCAMLSCSFSCHLMCLCGLLCQSHLCQLNREKIFIWWSGKTSLRKVAHTNMQPKFVWQTCNKIIKQRKIKINKLVSGVCRLCCPHADVGPGACPHAGPNFLKGTHLYDSHLNGTDG